MLDDGFDFRGWREESLLREQDRSEALSSSSILNRSELKRADADAKTHQNNIVAGVTGLDTQVLHCFLADRNAAPETTYSISMPPMNRRIPARKRGFSEAADAAIDGFNTEAFDDRQLWSRRSACSVLEVRQFSRD